MTRATERPADDRAADPDAALVTRALAGDRDACAALLARHAPDVARLCRSFAGPALADDCVQDTFLLAVLRLHRLRDAEALGSWLRGIALRVCRRARTRAARHPAADVDDLAGFLPGPDLFPDVDGRLAVADLRRSVRDAVASLPSGQRDAVTRFYLEGLSYDEAAAALGIPVGALKTRLHKARAALQHHYRLAEAPLAPPARSLSGRTIAIHEAGHAVLHWLYGGVLSFISIRPRAGPILGFVKPARPVEDVGNAGHALQVLMGGEAALALSSGALRDSGDRANAARIARAATGGDDVEAALFISAALDAARERLEDSATWALVERVGGALVERRQLDADEFRKLVSR